MNDKLIKNSKKYWKLRCIFAEQYIKESPCDPAVTEKQWRAYQNWTNFKFKIK